MDLRVRSAWVIVIGASLVAVGALIWIIYFKPQPEGGDEVLAYLPQVNCTLNAMSAVCLLAGFKAIKRGKAQVHMRWMLAAFGCSTLFLVSYVLHHHLHGDTKFPIENSWRPVYLFILGSHIVLSILGLPMILMTFFFALSNRLASHRRLARITFPVWLYVSITGVLVFVFLKTAGA